MFLILHLKRYKVKLEKYIHELLLENDTVIIPGFGAFISKYKPAEINEDEIKPPSKEISFTQQIRNNDGLLVGHIANKEQISHFDALKRIEKERENIIFQLDKGEKITLKEIGILSSNKNNEFEFEPFQDENLLLESFGLESFSLNKQEETKEEETSEEIVEPEEAVLQEEQIIEEKTEPNEIDTAPEIEPEQKETEPEAPILIKPEPEPETVPENKPEKEPKVIPEPIFKYKSKDQEKKKRSWVWYLLIIIPIIIAGFFVSKNKTNSEKPTIVIQEENSPQSTPEPEKNTSELDTLQKNLIQQTKIDTTEIAIPEVETTEISNPDLPKFYLVGGSFKSKENADNYLNELKTQGFEPFHLGKKGNFFILGIGTYNTEKEALEAKRNFTENNPGSGIWIYEK